MASFHKQVNHNTKSVNIYIRRHSFVVTSTDRFTTSQRRSFLRDVYDYSRAIGLSKREAKGQIIKARAICGEEEYDSDDTSLENEIDDSASILEATRQNGLHRSEGSGNQSSPEFTGYGGVNEDLQGMDILFKQ
jgi:hypothetical protein